MRSCNQAKPRPIERARSWKGADIISFYPVRKKSVFWNAFRARLAYRLNVTAAGACRRNSASVARDTIRYERLGADAKCCAAPAARAAGPTPAPATAPPGRAGRLPV